MTRRGWLLFAAMGLIWGIPYLLIKVAVGEVSPTSAGATRHATLDLTKPGTYRFRCGVSDHESRGMVGTFVVS